MGLDMYAYVAANAGQQGEFYEGAQFDKDSGDYVNPKVTKPREIAYWRKHPNLHGWMESLWKRKLHESNKQEPEDNGWGSTFNGIELELTADDLDELERAVTHGQLPSTTGFFFGNDADDFYRESDLAFIKNARAELFFGLKVFYNSSW
jgi:hypothetical protein